MHDELSLSWRLSDLAVAAWVLLGLGALATAWRARRRRTPARGWLPTLAGLALVALVVGHAWIVGDAGITFRSVENLLHGYGLVFNRGERVQGFTHPLWALLLVPGQAVVHPYTWALTLGFVLTGALVVTVLRARAALGLGAGELALVFATLGVSEAFLTFQTSGLENSLSNALLVVALALSARLARDGSAPRSSSWLALTLWAMVLTRLDNALIAAALALGAASVGGRALWPDARRAVLVGAFALGAWFAFATVYYGFPLPNTWYAKVGGDPLAVSSQQGLAYLRDELAHDPVAAVVALLGVASGLLAARGAARSTADRVRCAAAVGAVLHGAYVVAIGGDYMRGRFVVPELVTGAVLAAWGLARSEGGRLAAPWLAAAVALAGGIWRVAGDHADAGHIVDERRYHPEMHVGVMEIPWANPLPRAADALLAAGPAVSTSVVSRAFLYDPRVAQIDGLGLTDAFIARCPGLPGERPGHRRRVVPREYLQARGDVRLLRDGEARLWRADPSLAAEVRALRPAVVWTDPGVERVYRELTLLTRGPIFARERLRLLPRYFAAGVAVARVAADDAVEIVDR